MISGKNILDKLSVNFLHVAKLLIFYELRKLEENFEVVNAEDTAIAYLAALPGDEQLHVAPASVKIVSQRDTISEFEDRAVGFPYRNIHRVAAVKHSASRSDVY